MRLSILLAVAAWALTTIAAQSQDAPSAGTTYNTTENSSLQYECVLHQPKLDCTFIEVSVSKPKVEPVTQAAIDGLVNEKPDPKQCAQFGAALGNLDKGKDYTGRAVARDEASAFRPIITAFKTFCDSPTPNNARAILQAGADKVARTCNVWGWNFDVSFTWNFETSRWESVVGPVGPCGKIKYISFTKEVSGDFTTWNYVEKGLVTNREGDLAGISCNTLHDEVQTYSWRSRDIRPMCEFIKFGMF